MSISSSSSSQHSGSGTLQIYAFALAMLIGFLILSMSPSGESSNGRNTQLKSRVVAENGSRHIDTAGGGKPMTTTTALSLALGEEEEEEEEEMKKIVGATIDGRQPLPILEKPEVRPPLSELITDLDKGVVGDVQWLLDFSIVGHSKTATTELMNWLSTHDQIEIYTHELYYLTHKKPAELVQSMYELGDSELGPQKTIRGYKSPHELQRRQPYPYYEKHFPRTKMIVGLRHPIRWFESFYNFNWRMGNHLKDPETYFEDGTYPGGEMFHEHLARLGKTSLTEEENQLLGRSNSGNENSYFKWHLPNPVFLYEPSQLFDANETRAYEFRRDLSDFLGLDTLLEPKLNTRHGKGSDYHYKIDICEPRYTGIRHDLLVMGHNASQWLIQYFLDLPDVYYSSPDEHFEQMLSTWSVDPCDKEHEEEEKQQEEDEVEEQE